MCCQWRKGDDHESESGESAAIYRRCWSIRLQIDRNIADTFGRDADAEKQKESIIKYEKTFFMGASLFGVAPFYIMRNKYQSQCY